MRDSIFVKGARENNLKNIDIEIPRDKLVVFTGLSGSGKSSPATQGCSSGRWTSPTLIISRASPPPYP